MASVQEAIDLTSRSPAYDQWTQFESFPLFMGGVERVEQKATRRATGSPRSPASSASSTPRSPSSTLTSGSPGSTSGEAKPVWSPSTGWTRQRPA